MKFKKEDLHPDGRPFTKEEFINKIKTDGEFAKRWGELGPVYGKQWRQWSTHKTVVVGHNGNHNEFGTIVIDQIQNLINDLKTNPDSRRLMVSAWNVGELDQCVLPPCHYGFQVYTRELSLSERTFWIMSNRPEQLGSQNYLDGDRQGMKSTDYYGVPTRAISLMYNTRSQDVPLGTPFNISSYALLLEIIAKMVNMVPEELITNMGDCHIYLNQIDGIKEQLTREPYPLPKLNINTEWWPTEGGSCGEGPLDVQAVLDGFSSDSFASCLIEEDIQLYNYKSHPAIKMPLSN
jgi:thymidylate synthase